jgi:hypothetical protein
VTCPVELIPAAGEGSGEGHDERGQRSSNEIDIDGFVARNDIDPR